MNIEAKEFGPTISSERYESDIVDIHFYSEGLDISICTIDHSGGQVDLIVHFEYCDGLRYLDEGDLIRYWESDTFRPPCHIFKITSGGWSNGEVLEPGVLSIRSGDYTKEWFILTANGCMSVLCDKEPTWEFRSS